MLYDPFAYFRLLLEYLSEMTEWLQSYEDCNGMHLLDCDESSIAVASNSCPPSKAMELDDYVFASWRSHTLFYTVASSMFYLFIVRYREVVDAEDGMLTHLNTIHTRLRVVAALVKRRRGASRCFSHSHTGENFVRKLNWHRLLDSPLNPLLVCHPYLSTSFTIVCR